nr:unnamed protein product [Spirometra erinaceieuropaei]
MSAVKVTVDPALFQDDFTSVDTIQQSIELRREENEGIPPSNLDKQFPVLGVSESPPTPTYALQCDPPSEGEVTDAIRKLRNNKAPGEDGIPAEIFKSCVDTSAPSLHEIIEQAWRNEQPTAVCFIDFAAAFDSVHRESQWRIMALDGVPPKIIAYYRSTTARVLVHNNLSKLSGIRSGVRQSCILSPILFNYATDWILGRALHEDDGVEFAPGHWLTGLDYAEDIALLDPSFGDLQSMVS